VLVLRAASHSNTQAGTSRRQSGHRLLRQFVRPPWCLLLQ